MLRQRSKIVLCIAVFFLCLFTPGMVSAIEMPRAIILGQNESIPRTHLGKPYDYQLISALQETDAYILARELVSAQSVNHIEQLLDEMFALLDIPVFQGTNGQSVNGIGLVSSESFYLYDFQTTLLAEASLRPIPALPSILLAGLEAAQFDFSELTTTETVEEVLKTADEAWAGVAQRLVNGVVDQSDMLPMLVWSILYEQNVEAPKIHTVAQFLLLLDTVWEQGEQTIGSSSARRSSSAGTGSARLDSIIDWLRPKKAVASGSNLCEQLSELKKEIDRKENKVAIGGIKEWAERRWPKLKSFNEKRSKVTDMLDIMYRMVLQLGYVVKVNASPQEIHYQHSSSGTRAMDIEAFVEFVLDMGEAAVKCGVLAGYEFPPPGPVSGMRVEWTLSENLHQHGQVSGAESTWFGSLGGLQGEYWNTTGSDGKAVIKFTPNVEDPRGNYKIVDTGVVWARIRGAQKDLVGFIGEALFAIEEVERIWISYHEKREKEPKRPTPFQSWNQRPRVLPPFQI